MTSKSTAYHEAGHTVMHILRGLPFEHVSIVPTDDYEGVVRWNIGPSALLSLNMGNNSRYCRTLAIDAILCFLAGPAAEERLVGAYDEDGASYDLYEVNRITEYYSRNPEKYKKTKFNEARRIIKQNWSMVDKIAVALLERQSLERGEVFALLEMEEPD